MSRSTSKTLIQVSRSLMLEMRALVHQRRAIAQSFREAAAQSRDRLIERLQDHAAKPDPEPHSNEAITSLNSVASTRDTAADRRSSARSGCLAR